MHGKSSEINIVLFVLHQMSYFNTKILFVITFYAIFEVLCLGLKTNTSFEGHNFSFWYIEVQKLSVLFHHCGRSVEL